MEPSDAVEPPPPAPPNPPAPHPAPWDLQTRRWVVIGLVIAGALLVYAIRETLSVLVLALLLAYLLNPLVAFLQHRGRWPRLLAIGVIYLALVALLLAVFIAGVPILFRQLRAFVADLDQIAAQVDVIFGQMTWLGALGIRIDSAMIIGELRAQASALALAAPRFLIGVATDALRTVLILVLSFYLLKDAEGIDRQAENSVPEAYRPEWSRIKGELTTVWSSFLRGQILLALIIGVATTAALLILGVRNALLLGLLAGVLEVVPTLGPILAAIPAVFIAFLQGSTHWAVDHTTFAVIVVIAYILIQQMENHLIVPNVLGASVNLPAIVILFGALAGASLAGILGIFLAAPVLATARLFGGFLLRKLFEPLPPAGRGS